MADGKIHIISYKQGQWQKITLQAHDSGINGLSWGPATEPCLLMAENEDYIQL